MKKINIGKAVLVVFALGVILTTSWFVFKKPIVSEVIPAVTTPVVAAEEPFNYIEIIAGCGPYYDTGTCVNMRSGPSVEYKVTARLRTGIVLKVKKTTLADEQDPTRRWYQVTFNETLMYPDRLSSVAYVAVDPTSVRQFYDVGDVILQPDQKITTQKSIVVDLSQEKIYAYDGKTLFIQEPISTGLEFTPTPLGKFTIFKKTPSRYMQGPIPGLSDQEYDLPGVPWDLYFTYQGAVIHGAYWHDHFGEPWSHGCVNMATDQARKLYEWVDIGTQVLVQK